MGIVLLRNFSLCSILLVFVFCSSFIVDVYPSSILSNEIRGIVYILPSKYCSPLWRDVYGDRIYFYVYANLSRYRDGIEWDFKLISRVYNLVVIVVPADDTDLYRYNLALIDSIARRHSLRITWAIFPKSKYGREDTYLDPGTPMHRLILNVMQYLANLSSTYHIAIWYGWSYRQNGREDIWRFYNSLPQRLRDLYAVWVDRPYIESIIDINISIPIYTEIYDPNLIPKYTGLFRKQILVTGYQTHNISEWIETIGRYIELSKTKDIVIWIYYDINDGHGEHYYAYKPGIGLGDPWSKHIVSEPKLITTKTIERTHIYTSRTIETRYITTTTTFTIVKTETIGRYSTITIRETLSSTGMFIGIEYAAYIALLSIAMIVLFLAYRLKT